LFLIYIAPLTAVAIQLLIMDR